MTRRFFYTEPLAAAWMAKHFGMKFQMLEISDSGVRLEDIEDKVMKHLITESSALIYIQPDSLPLLAPHVGDLVWSPDESGIFGVVAENSRSPEDKENPILILTSTDGYYRIENISKIIQRNGIPFHWPESEELEGRAA
jgi:hypothetical protein